MNLISRPIKYSAEKVSTILKLIKDGKAQELPVSIYHAYESGHIYIGIGNSILVRTNNSYETAMSNQYLLVCSEGGALSIVDGLSYIEWNYDLIDVQKTKDKALKVLNKILSPKGDLNAAMLKHKIIEDLIKADLLK